MTNSNENGVDFESRFSEMTKWARRLSGPIMTTHDTLSVDLSKVPESQVREMVGSLLNLKDLRPEGYPVEQRRFVVDLPMQEFQQLEARITAVAPGSLTIKAASLDKEAEVVSLTHTPSYESWCDFKKSVENAKYRPDVLYLNPAEYADLVALSMGPEGESCSSADSEADVVEVLAEMLDCHVDDVVSEARRRFQSDSIAKLSELLGSHPDDVVSDTRILLNEVQSLRHETKTLREYTTKLQDNLDRKNAALRSTEAALDFSRSVAMALQTEIAELRARYETHTRSGTYLEPQWPGAK